MKNKLMKKLYLILLMFWQIWGSESFTQKFAAVKSGQCQLAQLPELQTYVNKEFIKIEKRFKNKSFYLNDWRFDFRSKEKRTSAIETFVD